MKITQAGLLAVSIGMVSYCTTAEKDAPRTVPILTILYHKQVGIGTTYTGAVGLYTTVTVTRSPENLFSGTKYIQETDKKLVHYTLPPENAQKWYIAFSQRYKKRPSYMK